MRGAMEKHYAEYYKKNYINIITIALYSAQMSIVSDAFVILYDYRCYYKTNQLQHRR